MDIVYRKSDGKIFSIFSTHGITQNVSSGMAYVALDLPSGVKARDLEKEYHIDPPTKKFKKKKKLKIKNAKIIDGEAQIEFNREDYVGEDEIEVLVDLKETVSSIPPVPDQIKPIKSKSVKIKLKTGKATHKHKFEGVKKGDIYRIAIQHPLMIEDAIQLEV